jgi:hypothetical protein
MRVPGNFTGFYKILCILKASGNPGWVLMGKLTNLLKCG